MNKRKYPSDDGSDTDSGFTRNVRARKSYAVGARKSFGRPYNAGSLGGAGSGSGAAFDDDDGSDTEDLKQVGEMRASVVQRDGFPTSIRASGRTAIVHNQCVIAYTARVDKNAINKLLQNEPAQMMIPFSLRAGQEALLKVLPGELALQDCSGRALSEAVAGHNNNTIFTSLNGLSKRCKLRVRGIVAGDGEGGAQRRGDDAVACQATASNTIINTGPEPVFTGDDLIADEVPYARRKEDGTWVSCIEHAGAPIEKLLPAIHAVRCNDMEADLARARAVVDDIVSTNPTETEGIQAVFDYFTKEDVKHGNVQSLKNYALFYSVVVRDKTISEDKHITAAITEGLDDLDVRDHRALFGAAAGSSDVDLYNADGVTTMTVRQVMIRCMQRAADLLRDRFRRLRIGKCLKGAPPGQQIDVAFGTHSTV